MFRHCCFVQDRCFSMIVHNLSYEGLKPFNYHLETGSYFNEHITNVICGFRSDIFTLSAGFYFSILVDGEQGNLKGKDEELMSSVFAIWDI